MGANDTHCLVSLALVSAVLVLVLGTVAAGAQQADSTVWSQPPSEGAAKFSAERLLVLEEHWSLG